jgi:co-chaperonin GroES (HSP10)
MKSATAVAPTIGEQYRCLNEFVVVRRHEAIKTITDGGIEIPENIRQKSQKATVVAISNTEKELQIGDEVFITRYTTGDFEIDGEKLVILHRKMVYLYKIR